MRDRHLLGFVTGILVLSLGGGAPTAFANSTDADAAKVHIHKRGVATARFAAPAADALATGPTVKVRIAVGPRVSAVKVFAGTKNVSGRFAKHGRAFEARLPRSLFKPGTNTLLTQARTGRGYGGASSVSFILGRPASGLARVASGPVAKQALGAGPTGIAGSTQVTGSVPVTVTTGKPARAVLRVNGHRVADLRDGLSQSRRSWLVSGWTGCGSVATG